MQPVDCPCCGASFRPGAARFVATSPRMLGDPVLGADAPVRFHPVRFNAKGEAVDPFGGRSNQPACPACRTAFPRALLSHPDVAEVWVIGHDADDVVRDLANAAETSDISPEGPETHPGTGAELDRPVLLEVAMPDGTHAIVRIRHGSPPDGATIVTRDLGVAAQATHMLVADSAVPVQHASTTVTDDATGHRDLLRRAAGAAVS